jgi:glycosyltransferase involved in cell wall biosynthesis
MSHSQRSWFEQYLPAEKIHVVHHHVNTDFFYPANEEIKSNGKFNIVSLGGILRDMPLLLNLVEQLTARLGADNIKFNFLIPKNAREPFKNFPNVKLCGRISDEELRSLYHNATLGFMPLVDCTANNAVLEMMACGKAIVCSKAGGIGDYLDQQGALMFDQTIDAEQLVSDIIELLNNPQKREQMGTYNRQRALDEFSLEKTANKLSAVYHQVAAQDQIMSHK